MSLSPSRKPSARSRIVLSWIRASPLTAWETSTRWAVSPDAVFKFSPEGKFLNRFGGSGDQPGQFRAAHAIAVDGKGRVFVSDIKGIQVFDSDGRYLTVFKTDGSAFGMVFNDKNELVVAARNKVDQACVESVSLSEARPSGRATLIRRPCLRAGF